MKLQHPVSNNFLNAISREIPTIILMTSMFGRCPSSGFDLVTAVLFSSHLSILSCTAMHCTSIQHPGALLISVSGLEPHHRIEKIKQHMIVICFFTLL